MDIQLAIRFLKGEFDPEYSRAKTMQLLEQAKRNNPKTYVVKAASDWGYDDTKAGRRKLKPHLLDRPKKVTTGIIYTPSGKYQSQVKAFNKYYYLGVFDTEEEAIALANNTTYGLATSVWTENLGRAHRMAEAIEVGLCWINSWFLRDLRTPFGGAKGSGIGREGGVHSLEFYTELRNVCVKL